MLSDIGSVGFKVENFNKENMAILERTGRQFVMRYCSQCICLQVLVLMHKTLEQQVPSSRWRNTCTTEG